MAALASFDQLSKIFPDPHHPAGERCALHSISAQIQPGRVTGLVGPDGAGKTTLLRLLAGLLTPSAGSLSVLGIDPSQSPQQIHQHVGYMPQRFGLYEELSVLENLNLHADLRYLVASERAQTFQRLLAFTSLAPFVDRQAGRLSGGMKQKLGLACALLTSPRFLLLDEPSVGVDPLSRRELWSMVQVLVNQGVGVIWSTSYLDEAEKCTDVLVLHEGQLLFQGEPQNLTQEVADHTFLLTGLGQQRRNILSQLTPLPEVIDGVIQGDALRLVLKPQLMPPEAQAWLHQTLPALAANPQATLTPTPPRFEDAFVARLNAEHKPAPLLLSTSVAHPKTGIAVAADQLSKHFGSFIAADQISFAIQRGEIFGLLGPNGAGKSTTFKMMCGLLRPSTGKASVDGLDLFASPAEARARLGYMAQKFSLYGDLSVEQNLRFFSGVYGLRGTTQRRAIQDAIERFGFHPYLDTNAADLPLGFKQRLSLACAIMHNPAVLFLDEPTSGVDPLTRREFWSFINALVGQGVTVMVTTHFMDEAEYCDRIALIHQGRCIAEGSPDQLKARMANHGHLLPTLEETFIALVEQQVAQKNPGHA